MPPSLRRNLSKRSTIKTFLSPNSIELVLDTLGEVDATCAGFNCPDLRFENMRRRRHAKGLLPSSVLPQESRFFLCLALLISSSIPSGMNCNAPTQSRPIADNRL